MRCDTSTINHPNEAKQFQSTHLHEVRHFIPAFQLSDVQFQSTHLHEVRLSKSHRTRCALSSFNPRTYMRCDVFVENGELIYVLFQSTHLHEVRPSSLWSVCSYACFNPRTYMRCDRRRVKRVRSPKSFNPRTYMRCDWTKQSTQHSIPVSIHAPT